MKEVNKEVDNGIEKQPDEPDAVQTQHDRQVWVRTIILNLIIAATVSLARAAIDSLVNDYRNGYRHEPRDYSKGEYPF